MKNTINFMLIFILSILLVSKAYSCERMFNVNDGLEKSDLVYTGTIKSNVCENNITQIVYSPSMIWKGNKKPEYTITINGCNNADVGSDYLVFAKADTDGNYKTLSRFDFCSNDIGIEIKSNLREWFDIQWDLFRTGLSINWQFWKKWGSQYYIKELGEPKHKLND